MALNAAGGFVMGGETGLFLFRSSGALNGIPHDQPLPVNDLVADSMGRVYAGTIHWSERGMEQPGNLFLIEHGKAQRVLDEGIHLANGLGFSPDDRILYFADSAARRIYAYDRNPQDGSVSNRRVFAQIPDKDGIPDGLTVDSEGFVWCAMWYGAQVLRFDPEGKVVRRIPLPVSQVSSVAFGGEDLSTLYITTAADPWPSHLEPPGFDWSARPAGGSLYALRTDVTGRPENLANFDWPGP
jgi:D-xylonolactonase